MATYMLINKLEENKKTILILVKQYKQKAALICFKIKINK